MEMLATVPRDDFLGLIGLNSGAFDRRASDDQVALAFGCEVPAEQGRYLALDAIAMELTDQLVHHGIAQRKLAAILVRVHHQRWLDALTRAEWGGPLIFFAVGLVRYVDDDDPFDGYFVATGTLKEIAEAEERKRTTELSMLVSLVVINMTGVELVVKERAEAAGIKLPPTFTAEPGTPEHAAMRAEIADYQKRSQVRLHDKGRRRVPVPRSVRVSEVES
jgi:hypothetical protein